MTSIHNISRYLHVILILVMGVITSSVSAQGVRTALPSAMQASFLDDDRDADVQVREYDAEQNARIYATSSPLGVQYTKKHPLVIVGNWTFKPYSFINDHGNADGFQVDLLKQIFSSLHLPYTLQLMDWKEAKQMVRDGRAQLMVGIDKNDVTPHTGYGRTMLAEYKIGVMHRKTTPGIRSILLLTEHDTLYVMHGDYVDHYLKQYFGEVPPCHIEHVNADEALVKLLNGTIKYFVWGQLPLRDLIHKYGEEGELRVDDIDIPAGRMCFFGNDSILLHELDLQFQRIKARQLYEPLCQKWFVDGGMEKGGATVEQIIFIVFIVIFIVIFIISFIMIQQSGGAVNLKSEFRTISGIAIDMTQCSVLCIDVRRMWLFNVSGNMLPDEGLSMHDYEHLIHPDDIQMEYAIRKQVDEGASEMPAVMLRMRLPGSLADSWRLMRITSLIKQRPNGEPKRIYLVLTDETEHTAERERLDAAVTELSSIVEQNGLGMIFYDADGQYVSSNAIAHHILLSDHKTGASGSSLDGGNALEYLKGTHLLDFSVLLNGIIVEKNMDLWLCAPVEIPELNFRKTMDVRIQTIYDSGSEGTILGYSVTLRDITDIILLHHRQKEARGRLIEATNRLSRCQMELRFILRRNKITTFRWRKGNDYIETSHDLLNFDSPMPLHESQQNPEEYFSLPHNDIIPYKKPGTKDDQIWMQTFIVPEYDDSGNLKGAFGIQCDVTDSHITQERLRKETEKAENTGKQKTVFLANMTHELRTPLNAINGFAEIMMYLESADDPTEYLDIMRHNCQMLIKIIDNILQLSVMDSEGIELTPRKVDFAQLFPASVAEMRSYLSSSSCTPSSSGVKLQIDTPLTTLPLEIDYEHVIQVVDAFVNNAVKFTQKGFIRVGYRYVDKVLTIYCRDTGCGIPQEHQQDIFERFVKLDDYIQGTGLGLSVCRMIADSMGATIDVYSKEGEGATFSFSLKC